MLFLIYLISAGETTDFFPVNSLKPGLKGYGITAFNGTELDTFQVEIINVLKKVGVGHTIVLARLSGGPLSETGVLAGMSGSPVYIDGKLLGAVAYAWSFAKEPICGITPAEEMVSMTEEKMGIRGLTPIRGILAVSGIGENPFIDSLAECLNLQVVPAGRSKGKGGLLPGSPCGIVLVDGDGVISLMGTLTFIKDKMIYAFGHPALLSGEVELPFAVGEVSGLMPSYYVSFKFISPLKVIGSTVFDGATGIVAVKGRMPEWVDFNVKVPETTCHYRIAKLPSLYSYLTGSLVYNILVEHLGGDFEGTVDADFSIKVKADGTEKILHRSVVKAGRELHRLIAYKDVDIFNLLVNNPYGKVEIVQAELDVKPVKCVKFYRVKNIKTTKTEFLPGEEAEIWITFERFRLSDTTVNLNIRMPDVEGEYSLKVMDADAWFNIKYQRKLNADIGVLEYLEILNRQQSNRHIYIAVVSDEKTFGGGNVVLPPSRRFILSEKLDRVPVVVSYSELKFDGEVQGSAELRIKVRRKK